MRAPASRKAPTGAVSGEAQAVARGPQGTRQGWPGDRALGEPQARGLRLAVCLPGRDACAAVF